MPTRSARLYSLVLLCGDFFILMLAFTLAYIVRVQFDPRPLVADIGALEFAQTALLIIPFWIIIFAFLGLYSGQVYNKRLTEWGRLFIGSFIGILIVLGYSFIVNEPVFPARLVAVYAFVGSFGLLLFGREVMRAIRSAAFRFGLGISRVLVVGNSAATRDIASQMSDTKRSGYHIAAIAGPKSVIPESFGGVHFRTPDQALRHLEDHDITTIIQTDLYESSEQNQEILRAAQEKHINYCFIPGEAEFYSGKNIVDVFLGYPIISVHQTPLAGWGEVAKRIFDLIFGTLILIFITPLLLVTMLLQKAFNPGPVFYINPRMTLYGKAFGLLKFRSMRPEFGHKDAIEDFTAIGRLDLVEEYRRYRKVVSQRDPRITWFGSFLRKTSLDELPQILNVLRGEMSLVGPRPIEPVELIHYKGRGALLHSVKPGITGLWQVSGRNDLPFATRVELELYYAQNWSFWLDVKILLKTLPALLRRGGAR